MTDDETVELDRQRVKTMVHQLDRALARERMTPIAREHVETAHGWLQQALGADEDEDEDEDGEADA